MSVVGTTKTLWSACCVAVFSIFCLLSGQATSAEPGAGVLQGHFGLGDHYRVGRWTALRLEGVTSGQRLKLETLDGDGIRLERLVTVQEAGGSTGAATFYLPAGPLNAPVMVWSVDDEGNADQLLWRTRLNNESAGLSRPWFIGIGSALGLESLGRNELLGTEGALDVSVLTKAGELPDRWIGYDGVDLLVLSGSSLDVLAGASADQLSALRQWVMGGGQLFLSLGKRGPELLAAVPWLAEGLSAGERMQTVQADPSAIETYISARQPAGEYVVTSLELRDAQIVLLGTTVRREPVNMIFQRQYGLGRLAAFAGGLDESPLQDWKQRDDLTGKLIPLVSSASRIGGQGGGRSGLRYTELVGQLRTTLDQHAGGGQASFSALALVLICLIGLVGPLDYLIVNRWLGRPLLGWLTFPLMVVGISAILMVWHGKSVGTRVNRVAILDIDPSNGMGRGVCWFEVFSGEALRADVDVNVAGALTNQKPQQVVVGPWGFAGKPFGGIEVAGEDVRLPAYRLQQWPEESLAGTLSGVPLAPQSSKSIAALWQFETGVEANSSLSRRAGSEMLSGVLRNPLPVDLLDGYLVYRNLIYMLPTRVPTGSVAADLDSLQPKNFRWRLNRRRSGETASQSEPWNPAAVHDLDRLMEIVMFYQAAGGEKYAGLENRVLEPFDLSHALAAGRAVLVGRVESPEVDLQLHRASGEDDAAAALPLEQASLDQTYVRLILNVDESLASVSRDGRP